MVKHVTLKQSEEGWTATVATAHQVGDNYVALGETQVYTSKELAWDSILNEVESLDYENDTIVFNGKKVESFEDIESGVVIL